jgi:PAS domain S-box-containing protein
LLFEHFQAVFFAAKMNKRLHILHLEDEPDFAELVRTLLAQDGIDADVKRAGDRAEFEQALEAGTFDVVISDYHLPSFNGLEALALAKKKYPQTPFILVSGTIGEHAAIDSLKAGATDYVLKQTPDRLPSAVRRAVQEAEEHARLRSAETELVRRERYFRTLTENSLDVVTILDREGIYIYASPSVERVMGYAPHELIGQKAFARVHPDDVSQAANLFQTALENPSQPIWVQYRYQHKDGEWYHHEAHCQSRFDDPDIGGLVAHCRDVTERWRAADELRSSEKQYRLLFQSNPNPMWVFDLETLKFLEVNEAAIQHYGYSREEFLEMTIMDVRPQEKISHHKNLEIDPADRGVIWRHRRKDGNFIEVEIIWSPMVFHRRFAALTMATDVTERRRVEHRNAIFSKLSHRLSSATTATEAATIICEAADALFKWDDFALDLYSAERDEVFSLLNITTVEGKRVEIPASLQPKTANALIRRVVSRGPELLSSIEAQDHAAATMLAPIRKGERVIGVLFIQNHSPGSYTERDLEMLQTLSDQCSGALERVRAEGQLRESQQRFRDLFENSPDAIFVESLDGTVLDVNFAGCVLHNLTREQLVGKNALDDLVPTAYRDEARRDFQKLAAGKSSWVGGESLTADGRATPVEVRAGRIEFGGEPALLLHVRDVTAQRRLEEQLRQSQKMEAIGQLAGGVAHDFNNILTVIHGHASLLGMADLDDTSARSTQQIIQAAERAAGLTRQLLTFSRRQLIQPKKLDMNKIVGNMTDMLGRLLGEDIALKLNYCQSPAMVEADAGMMEQVLLNLAVNARDAMPRGGQLGVRIAIVQVDESHIRGHSEARIGQFVCVSKSDTGSGIAPENLPRIFEPFFTTKEIGKGTGLGLATVYGIVKQHQGWIEVESAVGKGSTFRIFIPFVGEEAVEAEKPTTQLTVHGGTETILLVEDEKPVRELVARILQKYGYKVLQAETGAKAVEIWRQHKNDIRLLLTDLVMPENMNGRELAETLWREQPDLKVVFTSGYSADIVGKDFKLEADLNFLQKPYHPQTLALTVRRCLDGKRT